MCDETILDLTEEEISRYSYFLPAWEFIKAGKENRVLAVYSAYRRRDSWRYSFPLEKAVGFVKHMPYLEDSKFVALKLAKKAGLV